MTESHNDINNSLLENEELKPIQESMDTGVQKMNNEHRSKNILQRRGGDNQNQHVEPDVPDDGFYRNEDQFYDQNLAEDPENGHHYSRNYESHSISSSSHSSHIRISMAHVYLVLTFLMLSLIWRSNFHSAAQKREDELLFFNVAQGRMLAPLSTMKYRKGGPAMVTLVTNITADIDNLQMAVKSLEFIEGDDPKRPAPILVFNEGDLSGEQVKQIVTSTHRPVAFPIVNLSTFPKGFRFEDGPEFSVKNRKPWGYYQMIRFWVTGLWKHPALEDFETIMRFDSDSCFKSINKYLPNFAHDRLVYHSQFVGYEAGGETFVKGLYPFVHQYIHDKNIKIRNPLLWQFISTSWESKGFLPLYNTNFEVSSKSFMQRKDVTAFHESLTEKPPYGVLTHRWGDAVLRMFTTALFADDELIMQSPPDGYYHKDGCKHDEVQAALDILSRNKQTH